MPIRPFTDTLRKIRRGGLADELSEELNRLTKACTETGRAGELVLKLKLKPDKGGHVEVLDDVTLRMPKAERGVSIFFATPDNNLQLNNPIQGELSGIRSVDAGEERPVRDVRAAG